MAASRGTGAAMAGDETDPMRIFHVVPAPFHDGCYVVTRATMEDADRRLAEYEERYAFETFGDLRRSDSIDLLIEQLDNYGVGLDTYLATIEQSAGIAPSSNDAAQRLAALVDADFFGAEESEAPSDSTLLAGSDEYDTDPLYFTTTVYGACTRADLSAAGLEKFVVAESGEASPMTGDEVDEFVPDDDVETVVAALVAGGYTVVRDDQ